MTTFLAALQHPWLPRAGLYAVLAALVTTALFAADGAYRRYQNAKLTVVVPSTSEPIVQAGEPERVEKEAEHVTSPAPEEPGQLPKQALTGRQEQPDERSVSGSIPSLAGGVPVRNPVDASVPRQVAPQQKQPKASKQTKRPQVRRAPEKQAVNDRPKPHRQVQAESPNVYWERDPQLGFAAQLRKRTCNPATGNMPMQCYYPREGRENFPSKPLN